MHSLFDYNEGKKSFNQISALMVRAKNHSKGLPQWQHSSKWKKYCQICTAKEELTIKC
jgi:hypothetical protein